MTTQVNGDTGVSQCQPNSVSQDDLQSNVVGKGPVFFGSRSIDLGIAADTFTTLNYPDVLVNEGGGLNGQTGLFQPTVAGYYQLNATANFNGASVTRIRLALLSSNAAYGEISISDVAPYAAGAGGSISVSGLVYFNGTSDSVLVRGFVGGGSGNIAGKFNGALVRAA